MVDNWSLKSKIVEKTEYLTDDDKEYPVGKYYIYKPKDTQTLKEKLIEDLEDYWWEDADLQSILEIIKKRFGDGK